MPATYLHHGLAFTHTFTPGSPNQSREHFGLPVAHSLVDQVCQPKEFKNYPTASGTFHFDNCPTGPWYEFPLMSGGDAVPMHTGPKNPGRQNPARVIFKYTDANTAKFCGVLTHSNLTQEGQFIACDEV